MRHAVYEAMTDLYALLPLGHDRSGAAVPLLRKRQPVEPGLTGPALDAAVKRFMARVPHARGGRVN